MMSRASRIAGNLLLPTPISVAVFLPYLWFIGDGSKPTVPEAIGFVLFALIAAFAISCIPALVHVFVMEWFYKKGLLVSQFKAVGVSALSGLLAGGVICVGFTIIMVIDEGGWNSLNRIPEMWRYFPSLGVITGAFVGLILLGIERRYIRRKPPKAPVGSAYL